MDDTLKKKIVNRISKSIVKAMCNPNFKRDFYNHHIMVNGFITGSLENRILTEGGQTVSDLSEEVSLIT